MRRTALGLLAAGAVGTGLLMPAALAQTTPAPRQYRVDLGALNSTGADGTATLTLEGNTLTVDIQATGLLPDAPHAQHLHGFLQHGMNVCPPAGAAGDDGVLTTTEGLPFYGPINVTLTTEGGTSPEDALAVDRLPVADARGNLSYNRTFEVSDEVADHLELMQIVQHGVDLDGSGTYDGPPSELNPDLPQEATAPADCGDVELTAIGGNAASRVAGATRYATAVEVSQRRFSDPAAVTTVYVASGERFPDAVAGTMLAMDAPVLLVPSCGQLPAVVADELARLAPDEVVAIGGPDAVCVDVLAQAVEAANRA